MILRPRLMLAALACLVIAPVASAATFPSHINLMGAKQGVPDPFGTFTVTFSAAPSPATVDIDFGSYTDILIANPQPDASLTTTCFAAGPWVTAPVVGLVATFTIVGGSRPPATPGPLVVTLNNGTTS